MPAQRRRLILPRGVRTALLFLALGIAALAVRSFAVAPRLIPSESMLPALWPGDFMLIAKWRYGYSRHSLPMEIPLWRGRILAATPARGAIVIFRQQGSDHDQVKRVIGLPGDTVALRDGTVLLDGAPLPRVRIADLVLPVSPNTPCRARPEPGPACRYRRFVETLPGGHAYPVLDSADLATDRFGPVTVPPGHVFLLGDNRDRSEDSRAFGMVPLDRLLGGPLLILWSGDGSARLGDPRGWWRSLRTARIGVVPHS